MKWTVYCWPKIIPILINLKLVIRSKSNEFSQIIPDRRHPKCQWVELQFRQVYWQPILPAQSPCDRKLFQEILSKIEPVGIYQMIDNEFQVHAIYFATRPAVFPKPTLCEVKPKENVTNWNQNDSDQKYLFFNDFLPESLNILLIILSSTMYDRKFDLGQVIFFCILLKMFSIQLSK